MKYYIGCSGFSYKDWKGIFYPEGLAPKHWFRFYSEHYNSIEINSSFYKRPSLASLQKWYEESRSGFLFTLKAPRFITHLKRMNVEKTDILDFYELAANGFKEKLGCLLFQLPPSFHFTAERLQLICTQLDPGFRNVVEFRHKSWWREEVFELLGKHNISFSGQSYPSDLPDEAIKNNSVIYYRFHGTPILYKSEYEIMALQKLIDQVGKGEEEVFIYFNNTWGPAGLINSRQMQELVNANV
jgi:uncharacterized protein YecE (DUF72 family)